MFSEIDRRVLMFVLLKWIEPLEWVIENDRKHYNREIAKGVPYSRFFARAGGCPLHRLLEDQVHVPAASRQHSFRTFLISSRLRRDIRRFRAGVDWSEPLSLSR
jgi:hypothetical protein